MKSSTCAKKDFGCHYGMLKTKTQRELAILAIP